MRPGNSGQNGLPSFASWRLVLSCEHAGNRVPPRYRHLFEGREAILDTHRGYDIGILDLARRLSRELDAPLFLGDVTRLLVDLNRSPRNRTLFSEFSRSLPLGERRRLMAAYYHPYRQAVAREMMRLAARGPVLHLSLHTFTPVWRETLRPVDLSLMYDPVRRAERAFCLAWMNQVRRRSPELRVRRNFPYRGRDDSLLSWLRTRLRPPYLGIQLELNQALALQERRHWLAVQDLVVHSLSLLTGRAE